MKITTREQIKKGLRVRFVDGYEGFSIGNSYLAESEVIVVRDEHVYNDAYGNYIMLESGDNINSGYGYIKDLLIDERPESELPYFQVYIDRGNDVRENLKTFICVMDAHNYINKVRHSTEEVNFDKWKVKLDKWKIVDGVPTKLEF